ncbi:SDR family NAD(P)-dependent oxidoreductase [uncultured Mycolicibacterium sp.]|uniref:SDR family NAD(P)-dependent oxidoreductase n=1 Tax=uncultured Mycolicibacterium sp. TaxID=2320817 RepID=UPI0026368DD5|nr:SDR family NAD(P)-dependent oxidoreductase [uncultured Mycolicibacterium sp.]
MSSARSVIITGAGSGIGAGIAKVFAEAGDRVFLADISEERAATVADALPGAVSAHRVDVTDLSAVQGLAEQVVAETGRIDVLVSNAGVFDAIAGIRETTPALWQRVIDINLTGTYNVVKSVAETMISQQYGRIVCIGSIAGQRSLPDGLAYCASKAGLEGFVRRLAYDLGRFNITANVVAPGLIKSNIRQNSAEILGDIVPDTNVGFSSNVELRDLLIPARRGGDPADIASAVFYLASESAGYVSGEVLHVDGGWIGA